MEALLILVTIRDHYIYYCGQESLRRNGVAIMVKKRVLLLQGRALVDLLADHQGTSDLGSAPARYHAVVPDEVVDDTQSVVTGMLGLLDDHLISSSDENDDGSGVLTLLDDQHLVSCGPK